MSRRITFKILIDRQERNGIVKSRSVNTFTLKDGINYLNHHLGEGVCGENTVHSLPAGDYWIVRVDEHGKETVCSIIERKTHSDIVRSQREVAMNYKTCNRMEVQMSKMKSSGVADVMYVIEGVNFVREGNSWRYAKALHQSSKNLSLDLQVYIKTRQNLTKEGFRIHDTRSYNGTLDVLVNIYKQVLSRGGPIEGYEGPTWNRIEANIDRELKELKSESESRFSNRTWCGIRSCKCVKARDGQSCRRCSQEIEKGDCIVNKGGWQHKLCRPRNSVALIPAFTRPEDQRVAISSLGQKRLYHGQQAYFLEESGTSPLRSGENRDEDDTTIAAMETLQQDQPPQHIVADYGTQSCPICLDSDNEDNQDSTKKKKSSISSRDVKRAADQQVNTREQDRVTHYSTQSSPICLDSDNDDNQDNTKKKKSSMSSRDVKRAADQQVNPREQDNVRDARLRRFEMQT
jgi:ERCC4-type nuclease